MAHTLKTAQLDTPLGPMVAIADERALHLLEFIGCKNLNWEIERLQARMQMAIVVGRTDPIASIEEELRRYFTGQLKEFKTALSFEGTPFQKSVWEELMQIPYGQTRSYSEMATRVGKPSAFRALAQANGANQLSIIIPCHRVINLDGSLGGYGGTVPRKKWLLEHEKI